LVVRGRAEGLASFDDLEDPEEKESERRPAKAPVRRGEPTAEDLAALDATDWPPLVREIAELRDRMAGMGSVNLVAVEEYSSLRERHDFLTKQSDDLWKAKEELTKAIDEPQPDLPGRLFTDTFEQVPARTSSSPSSACSSAARPTSEPRAGRGRPRERHRDHRPAARHEAARHLAALRRPAHHDGGRPPVRDLHGEAVPRSASSTSSTPRWTTPTWAASRTSSASSRGIPSSW
jgi:hypothetical protein